MPSGSGYAVVNCGQQVLFLGDDTNASVMSKDDPALIPNDTANTDGDYFWQVGDAVADGSTLWLAAVYDVPETDPIEIAYRGAEGPASVKLVNARDVVIHNQYHHLLDVGTQINVHPTPAQIDAAVGSQTATPVEITGEQPTDNDAILKALVTALDGLGLITDSTTDGE